jgi:ketosteroid isomerase-like protein
VTTETQTRQIVRSYHDAWVSGDVAAAGASLADEVTNPTSFNDYSTNPMSRAAYLDTLANFRQRVTGLDLMSELYGEGEATLVYDVHTTPGSTFHTAEHFRLKDGKISIIVLIFDKTPSRLLIIPAVDSN